MTVAGIGGCTALVVTGLGLRDSIFDILAWQFDEITCYDAAVSFSDEIGVADKVKLREELAAMGELEGSLECFQNRLDLETGDGKAENVVVTCIDDLKSLDGFIQLRHREHGGGIAPQYRDLFTAPMNMGPDGIVIDEKMAELLHVNVGDRVTLTDADEEKYSAVVSDITENYVNHYVYMTRSCWKGIMGDWPQYNTILIRLTEGADEEKAAAGLLSMDGVISYSRIDQMRTRFEEASGASTRSS